MARSSQFTVGVDFGTLSGRAVVVRLSDGAEVGSAVHEYAHGVLDAELPGGAVALPPDWALQVPGDYVDVIANAVPEAVRVAGIDPSQVVGLGTDFTACTVLPVLADGTPLCELPGCAERPHAYVKLWKHHAAQTQADRINELAHGRGEPWIGRYGGLISSEWEFAKGLQLLEEDPELYARADHLVEAADWIVWKLTGRYVRNACTAGYKGIYQDGRYPDRDFLAALNPGFAGFAEEKLAAEIGQLGDAAGRLTHEAAALTGLPEGTAVAVGNVDAHVTAPAARATEPGQMVAIMGTSTCHVMSHDVLVEVPGMCGVVDGGIVAGSWGYEAGQSGVGDIFGWFTRTSVPAAYADAARSAGVSVHEHLTRLAADQRVGEHGLVALDWHSGNRSVLVDHELSGAIVGLTLTTRPEDVYRALLEATAFGTRVIVETFRGSGVPVEELVVAGGLATNGLLMQIYADVTRMPLSVIDSEQGPALGSAIHAAVAAGAYPDVPTAAKSMGKVRKGVFVPDEGCAQAYDQLFEQYVALHDHFGRATTTMRRLKAIRRAAVASRIGGGS
jgi:L-ribulokinase